VSDSSCLCISLKTADDVDGGTSTGERERERESVGEKTEKKEIGASTKKNREILRPRKLVGSKGGRTK
jgi:hypothetical protein